MIKKLVSHLGEYKRAAVLTPLFAALEAVMDVLLPTIMAFIIDQGIEKGDMNAILKYGLLTFLVAVVALALGVLAGKYAAEASTGFAGNLREDVYKRQVGVDVHHGTGVSVGGMIHAGLVVDGMADGHAERDIGTVQLIVLLRHVLLAGRANLQGALVGGAQVLHLVVCLLYTSMPKRQPTRTKKVKFKKEKCIYESHRRKGLSDRHYPCYRF